VDPVESALDVGQTVGYATILWKNTEPDALDEAAEFSVRVPQKIHIDMRTDVDVLQFGFAIVCDDVPGPGINEGEHRAAGMGIGALGDVQIGYIGVKRRDHTTTLQIEPGAFNFGGLAGPFGLKGLNRINCMDGLTELGL
jgi:hypothetical protein